LDLKGVFGNGPAFARRGNPMHFRKLRFWQSALRKGKSRSLQSWDPEFLPTRSLRQCVVNLTVRLI